LISRKPSESQLRKGQILLSALYQIAKLRRNQWLSIEKLKEIQLKRLKAIVVHAYNNVPYYKNLFDSVGLRPWDIKTLEDIRKIPITRKSDLKGLPLSELLSKDIDMGSIFRRHTSGSTGVPFNVEHSWQDKASQALMNLRILMENGLGVTDKVAHIVTRQMMGQKFWFQSLGILRKYYIQATISTADQLALLKEINPDAIYGYSSSIKLLALRIRESGKREINPRMIFCTSELLEPGDREFINSTFDLSVCDVYGTVELGDIAWECPAHEGYHIDINNFVVEFLKDGKDVAPGEEGNIVCTSLHADAMPFIRYEVGDICVPLDRICSCGRGLPLMSMIRGRADDFIVTPDGQYVSPLIFEIPSILGVGQYRIVQKQIDKLLVQIVPTPGFTKESRYKVRQHVRWAARKITGNNVMNVEVDIVDTIPKDPSSNKIKRVISEIRSARVPLQDRIMGSEPTCPSGHKGA
jgi:phenylacetate-CoA ligase